MIKIVEVWLRSWRGALARSEIESKSLTKEIIPTIGISVGTNHAAKRTEALTPKTLQINRNCKYHLNELFLL